MSTGAGDDARLEQFMGRMAGHMKLILEARP